MASAIGEAVVAARATLLGVRDAQPLYLRTEEKGDLLRELTALEAQVAELRLRVLTSAGDLAERDGARDIGGWLVAAMPVDGRTARSDARLAAAMHRWLLVADALAEGRVTLEQARVIVAALDRVADVLTSEQRAEAEGLMVTEAKELDPRRLAVLGRRLQAVVGQDDGQAAEALLLAEEEQGAAELTSLTIRPQGDGTTRITGTVADAVAVRLRTCLEAFAQPRKQALDADGRRAPYARLLGQALGDLLEHLDPADLPHHGGDATTVFVTMTLDQLRSELATASFGLAHDAVTATEARRLACEAGIVPVVMGGAGEVLDVGRRQRLHTPSMRKAIRVRDRTCRAEGCDVVGTWCDVHHLNSWASGGVTSVENGILLCSHHHHRMHDPRYQAERRPDERFRMVLRT